MGFAKESQNGENVDCLQNIERTTTGMKNASLQITLRRYQSGKLEKCRRPLNGTKYLSLSHVWGDAEWRTIPGVDCEALVSSEKASFLAEQLHSIIGSDFFWMDVLCIDQRNEDARIAVMQHIPAIFRLAQRTIVVGDGSWFRVVAAMRWET